MTLKRRLFARVRRQFGHPRGLAGRAAGWVMANWRSNRQRNTWVVSLLGVRPTERVLEVGFGPGLAIAELARRITDGRVYGVDGSEVMLQQATKRNAGAIQAGRVTVTLGTIERLPPAHDGPFDAVLTVNSLGFWTAPGERLECLRRRLTPGGRIAIASGPRCPGATRSTPLYAASKITDLLQSAGFTQARTEILDLGPPVVCVLAVNPASTHSRRPDICRPTS